MKLLFTLTHALNPYAAGVQRTTYKLGRKFTELGHEVAYYSTANTGNEDTGFGKLYFSPNTGNVKNPKNLEHLKFVLNSFEPDFVINQMPYELTLSKFLYKEKHVLNYVFLGCLRNSLFSVKNNVRDTYKRVIPDYLFKLLDNKWGIALLLSFHRLKHSKQLKKILDYHDRFILLTPPNNNELKYFVGDYKQEKVEVVPNSIPKVFYEKFKREKIILYVGTLNVSQKRADLLLDFWRKAHSQLNDWKFVLLGDGNYKNTMDSIIYQEKLPRIELKGNQKPEEWYKKAPVFVMTSAFEGFPNVILEAQSYGCIPVAFKSYDALQWIVNDKDDAILIDPYDIDEMVKEVVRLTTDKYDMEQMSENAKNNISRFVIDNVAQEWMMLFSKLKGIK